MAAFPRTDPIAIGPFAKRPLSRGHEAFSLPSNALPRRVVYDNGFVSRAPSFIGLSRSLKHNHPSLFPPPQWSERTPSRQRSVTLSRMRDLPTTQFSVLSSTEPGETR